MAEDFWLYKWIDEFEVTNQATSQSALSNKKALRRLRELADLADLTEHEAPSPYEEVENALVLGRDMDLSGDLDCCLDVSKTHQIDLHFGRLMHYFDRLIVSGPSACRYSSLLEYRTEQALRGIASHIEALVYVREIGAEDIIKFQPKYSIDSRKYRKIAKQFGLASVLDCEDAVTSLFVREGVFSHIRACEREAHWHFNFGHPLLEHDLDIVLWQKKKPAKRQMARRAFDYYAALLTSDSVSSQLMNLPLGSNADLHATMFSGPKSEFIISETALNIYLPVLDGIPLRDIIRLRRDEHDHFVKFQSALRAGIKKQLSDSRADPLRAAQEVQREIIEPSLSDINMRLCAAEKSLSKKISLGVGVGSTLTMIGALASTPLIIGSGLAVAATAVASAQNYIESKKDIELSDMYFLWLLEREHRKHRH